MPLGSRNATSGSSKHSVTRIVERSGRSSVRKRRRRFDLSSREREGMPREYGARRSQRLRAHVHAWRLSRCGYSELPETLRSALSWSPRPLGRRPSPLFVRLPRLLGPWSGTSRSCLTAASCTPSSRTRSWLTTWPRSGRASWRSASSTISPYRHVGIASCSIATTRTAPRDTSGR